MVEIDKQLIGISKLDTAKRELEHSIRLFFYNVDVVVIHLLAATAHQVLSDLGKRNGIKSFIRQFASEYIKEERREEANRALNKALNFFKHADNDPEDILKFNPENSELFILDAIGMYQLLTSELTGLMVAFRAWFFIKHPGAATSKEIEVAAKGALTALGKTASAGNRPAFLTFAEEFEKLRAARLVQGPVM